MCSSKTKLQEGSGRIDMTLALSHINGRPVLQPASNRVSLLKRRDSPKKSPTPKSTSALAVQDMSSPTKATTNAKIRPASAAAAVVITPPISPKLKSPIQQAVKRGSDPNGLNTSVEKVLTSTPSPSQRSITNTKLVTSAKKSKKCNGGSGGVALTPKFTDTPDSFNNISSLIVEAPGSIAEARREQVAIQQVQRKMRIAHYGRTKSAKFESKVVLIDISANAASTVREEKRCSFITANSDPIYVTYHDEEWGVPLHDDKLLFELLVLTGAQVGSDWTSVLKKRQAFREAFSGFDAEVVSKFSEKKIISTSEDYGIELSQVRGVVDNSNRILEIKKQFGSLDKYLWGFVNNKPVSTQYKFGHKIPVKTSKSETISKDMVRRGLRFVGPTVIHSFMQAAGLTNDHLISCPRHLQCVALASQPMPSAAPAL